MQGKTFTNKIVQARGGITLFGNFQNSNGPDQPVLTEKLVLLTAGAGPGNHQWSLPP